MYISSDMSLTASYPPLALQYMLSNETFLFVAEADAKLAEPDTEHKCPASEKDIAHLAHIHLQLIGYVGSTDIGVWPRLVRSEEGKCDRFAKPPTPMLYLHLFDVSN
jgi:hypothetical protein